MGGFNISTTTVPVTTTASPATHVSTPPPGTGLSNFPVGGFVAIYLVAFATCCYIGYCCLTRQSPLPKCIMELKCVDDCVKKIAAKMQRNNQAQPSVDSTHHSPSNLSLTGYNQHLQNSSPQYGGDRLTNQSFA